MLKKLYTEVKVPCYYYIENGCKIDHCKDCNFYNGEVVENGEVVGIDCLRGDIPSIKCHVTSFLMGDYEYRSRWYDEDKDGKIEGDDEYDFCQKCCFCKKLINGNEICLLRCGVDDDDKSNFMCYEGEIWEKFKRKED